MNLFVTWAPDATSLLPTDTFNVYYKLADSLNLNNWILANPTALPSTATSYTITGLTPNSVYRVAVEKDCVSSYPILVVETEVSLSSCPIYAYYQGPVVNGKPTLFYSLSYPNSNHVVSIQSSLYDITISDYQYYSACSTPIACTDVKYPIGRGVSYNAKCPTCPGPGNGAAYLCGYDELVFSFPSNVSSATGYYGLGIASLPVNCPAGSGSFGDPILLTFGGKYRLANPIPVVNVFTPPPYTYPASNPSYILNDTGACYDNAVGEPYVTIVSLPNDPTRLSGVQNYNSTTGQVTQVIIDGTNQTTIGGTINHYQFSYTVEDAITSNTFPLLTSSSAPVTSPSISFTRHAPLYINILPAQLTSGMDIICKTLNPFPGIVVNLTNVNMSGMTVANFCTYIANQLTNAGYPSDHVLYGGQHFIRFGLPNTIFTGAQIEVTGPAPVFASYNNNVYGLLNTSLNSVPWIVGDDMTASTVNAYTVGQYKIFDTTTWQSIPGGSSITAVFGDTIEFLMFDTDISIYEVKNLTTVTTYDLTNSLNLSTLPSFNTLNNITLFGIKCDNVELSNGDVLELKFTNPFVPSLPFVNQVTINF
mgnify:CR=1 FL=1